MIKKILLGIAILVVINWLWNIIATHELEYKIEQELNKIDNLNKRIERTSTIIDSLEITLKEFKNYDE